MSRGFYSTLPESPGLAALLREGRLVEAPADSWLACADVRGSTRAIAEGRYKDVNLAGAACITSILNACGRADLPFVFGGDGALLLVPDASREAARSALAGTVRMARDALRLELRAGLVPLAALRAAGSDLRVGRVRMSDGFHQAAFLGGAAALADSWLKTCDPRVEPVAAAGREGAADFSGLECRWRGVRPAQGAVATLIVEARARDETARRAALASILREIETLLGLAAERRPVSAESLHLTLASAELDGEARVVSGRSPAPRPTRWRVRAETAVGRFMMKRGLRVFGADWGRYKRDAAANTDFEKLDDALRMVVAASPEAVGRLRALLDAEVAASRAWYGLAVSEECRMTCLVLVRGREHFHFVDGAGGGYAAAAAALKAAKARATAAPRFAGP